jgi:signal peptidase I
MDTDTQPSGKKPGQRWPKLGLLIVAGLLLFLLGVVVTNRMVHHFAMAAYRIPSSAMEPTLHCARPAHGCEADTMDRVLALRFHPSWTPRRGEIVVFRTPPRAQERCGSGGTFVKRIVGLPGEQVSLRVRGGKAFVVVDGQQLDEPYIEDDRRDLGPEETFRVPEGQYFVVGDNRGQSCDSRVFGSVPRDNLIGPVVARFWPLDRLGSP